MYRAFFMLRQDWPTPHLYPCVDAHMWLQLIAVRHCEVELETWGSQAAVKHHTYLFQYLCVCHRCSRCTRDESLQEYAMNAVSCDTHSILACFTCCDCKASGDWTLVIIDCRLFLVATNHTSWVETELRLHHFHYHV